MNYLKDMNNKGYTIIELVISVGILGFLITGMVIMLLQQQRQFNFTKEIADIDTTGRTLLGFISSEVRNSGARQGKAFSIKFINGGSNPDNRCEVGSSPSEDKFKDVNTGTKDSPPDCIALYTWDLTAGLTTGNRGLNLPSTTETTLFYTNNGSSGLVIDLPESYFDGNDFIGKSNSGDILLGFRSRQTLCNPNIEIQRKCINNPDLCSECAMIFRATLNPSARKATAFEVIEHNFPIKLFEDVTEFETYILGLEDIEGNGQKFGFISSISSTPLEFNILQSKYFRIDTKSRGLKMAQNFGNFTIVGGGNDNDNAGNFLESPGIVDLQFVFNLQNPDGTTTRVGKCDFPDGAEVDCNNEASHVFSDFNQDATRGREQDIRSVDIYLVLKSKIRPHKQNGGFYEQTIPAIADVAERIAPRTDGSRDKHQSVYNEPENGFIYRVYSTSVYLRNQSREESL